MFALSKKILFACVLVLVVLMTGAWHSPPVVLAKEQKADTPETPLYSGLNWSNPTVSVQDIRININGDTVSLSGERYTARERFTAELPKDVSGYYSAGELAKSGWTSYDTVQTDDGTHYVFYHESGAYLAIEFIACPDVPSDICVAVWMSEQTDVVSAPSEASGLDDIAPAPATFGKKTPTNGATNQNPTSVLLSWNAYSPTPEKYSYCIKEGSACVDNDPNWTSVFDTSVTVKNLAYNKTYHWQVRAVTCTSCTPKTFVYADNGTVWTFKTAQPTHAAIIGNAGVAGAVLSYTDGTFKQVTADGVGNYSITVPLNWTGVITPAKSGYLFSPKNASFNNLTNPQTIQNFNAFAAYVISGNVDLPGVTLSYTDGTPQTVTSDSNGGYSIPVPANWSGTITPTKTGYTFQPDSRSYSNVTANKTAQNYTAMISISGNAGAAGAMLSYVNGIPRTVTANGSGNYSIRVPVGWTGTVTPSLSGFTFTPVNRSYSNLQSKQTAQDYTTLDAPLVLSIVRVDPSPTSASSVNFTVTFSEIVTGVDASDFTLTTNGLTGTSISLVNGSGATWAVTVATGSGHGTIRLDVADDDSIEDTANNPLGGTGAGNGNFTGGQVYEVNKVTVLSAGGNDGWILESTETSGVGGSLNKNAATLRIGDESADQQYRSILSFDTSVLPNNATIISVTLKLKFAGVSGIDPFNTHGQLLADIHNSAFSSNPLLELNDFKAIASKNKVLTFTNTPINNWYSQSFGSGDFGLVNSGGITQFRLRFVKDDNDDLDADYLKIFSGDAPSASRPQLVIEYSVP